MDFVDATLLKLAATAERPSLFDQAALAQLAAAAYDVDALAIEGPYQPSFEELRLGPHLASVATAEGEWRDQSDPAGRTELRLLLGGVAPAPGPRVDALWRGDIVARAVPLDSTIEGAEVAWRSSDPVEADGAVTVAFSPPGTAQPLPRELPVAVALLIRDSAGLSLAELLAGSHALSERLDRLPVERPADPALRPRAGTVVAWLLPAETFDDPGWPGATEAMSATAKRDARRAAAGEWLADEGIGLVAVS
ncbi:MAG TPA: hypothetical protein VF245_06850 [Solirubrobacterales bacterium]